MPRQKSKKSEKISEFIDEDKSLIVHLPIKVKNEDPNLSKEIKKLRKENAELKEKIEYLMEENSKRINIIKNQIKNNSEEKKKCWWCDKYSHISITLPNKKIKNKFYGLGSFCTLNCACAYNISLKDEKIWERHSLLEQLKDIVFPEVEYIKSAPPREIMIEFGGEKSRDEYDEELLTMSSDYIKLLPPMISTTMLIEQRKVGIKDINKMQLLGLKLKRNKPVVNKSFSLDNIISI